VAPIATEGQGVRDGGPDANEFVGQLHDRKPVILEAD
jgi:hypothetical protein